MRSREPKRFTRYVGVLLEKKDFERLLQGKSNSTCRSLSAYCRKLLMDRPVKVFYRDQSFDAFVEEAITLRKEMAAVREKPLSPEGERHLIILQEEVKKCINKIFDHVSQNRKVSGNG